MMMMMIIIIIIIIIIIGALGAAHILTQCGLG